MGYTNEDYTVGWICAHPTELLASTVLLDEEHPELHAEHSHGAALGQIGPHNIAITWLAAGDAKASAVTYAEQNLRLDFPNIRFVLMAGFGGGVPATPSDDPNKDIRLGDVVVSHSEGNHGGVLKYGWDQVSQEGEFTQREFFDKPPAILTDAISKLRSQNENMREAIPRHISYLAKSSSGMMEKFRYQGHEHDQLFEPDYAHKGTAKSCEMCDAERLVHRKLRGTEGPVIHYGIIGSGTQDICDGNIREKFRREQGMLCLETLACGLMPDIPCLVIRGICDYSDSHKNKRWQGYAAATAAAYAKELLQIMPAEQVAPAKEELRIMKQIPAGAESTNQDLERLLNEQRRKEGEEILDWIISSPTYEEQHTKILEQRQPGTGQWFLKSPEFTEWRQGDCKNLYCLGICGTGNSVLASMAIKHIRAETGRGTLVAFIYCNSQRQEEQTTENLLGMVLHQFLSQCASIPTSVKAVLESPMTLGRQPSILEIIEAISVLIGEKGRAYLVIDALDQCSDSVRKLLLSHVWLLQRYTDISVMATSRPIDEMEWQLAGGTMLRIRADSGDVECYLDGQLLTLCQGVRDDADLWKEGNAQIIKVANGSFHEAIYLL